MKLHKNNTSLLTKWRMKKSEQVGWEKLTLRLPKWSTSCRAFRFATGRTVMGMATVDRCGMERLPSTGGKLGGGQLVALRVAQQGV